MSVADLDWSVIALALFGAALAGSINTLAGNGSAITLSVLTEAIGLPGVIANATNRVGVLAQTSVSSFEFWRSGRMPWRRGRVLLVPVVLGALVGGYVASQVSNAAFREAFRWMLLLILGIVLVKPKRWLATTPPERAWPPVVLAGAGLVLGFYGGFIQMGFGPLFLAVAVLGAGFPLVEANALKAVAVAVYTVPLLVNFVVQDQVVWPIGLVMVVGQGVAAYFTARFAVRSAWVAQVAYGVLMVVVVGVVVWTFWFEINTFNR